MPIAHVEATLVVQKKEEGRYAAAPRIIVEIHTEIVNLTLVKIPTLVDRTQNVKQTATEQSVVAPEVGLEKHMLEVDVLIILAMKILVVQMLTVRIGMVKLYAHADQITKETRSLVAS